MNKKEQIKQFAIHFGERVACEWLGPDGCEWIKWKDAEINVHFLTELEKGCIRNIQIPNQQLDMVVTNFELKEKRD